MAKKGKHAALPARLKRRAVAVAINGNIPLPVMANKLGMPVKRLRRWKQKFKGTIKRRKVPAHKLENHVKLVKALGQRAMLQSKIKKLKMALQKA